MTRLMRTHALLATVALLGAPTLRRSALGAQRPTLTVEPHVGWTAGTRFYRGPVGVDYLAIPPQQGEIHLEAAPAWGARVSLRPQAWPWSLTLAASTAETYSVLDVPIDPASVLVPYRVRTPARLTVVGFGLARELLPASRRLGLTGRLAASVASTTFEPRRYRVTAVPAPTAEYLVEQDRKPWNRRYVSPGAELGADASLRLYGPLALALSGTVSAVRNETSAMSAAGRNIDSPTIERRDAYWMPVGRLTIGVALSR